jgi:protein-tyrosine-phosphatase
MRFSASRWVLIILAVALASVSSRAQESNGQASAEKGPTVLFVCEHGAAKSVIAAAYFNKLAKERGLKHRAVFRGTNPDPALAAVAEKGLKADGIDPSGWKPELVMAKDMGAAAGIVTLGCALPGKEAVAGKVVEWNGVPSPSENYQVARDDIVKRVERLVDELAKKEQAEAGGKWEKKKP